MDGKLGKFVKEKRLALGMSVIELADQAGVSVDFINALEKGQGCLDKIGRIAKVLKSDLYVLVSRD